MLSRVTVSLASVLLGVATGAVLTGSLRAGSLEPPGPPTPTMKTLDQIPPTWDQALPAATRFVLVLGAAAILDKETGLVWERSPATTQHNWDTARFQCTSRTTGGRKGWRVPSVHELASLLDPSVAPPGPILPSGHPFINIQSQYWAATTLVDNPTLAWLVGFNDGVVGATNKTTGLFAWCVRGATDADAY